MSLSKRIRILEDARATPAKNFNVFTITDGSRVYPDTPEARALANGEDVQGFKLDGLIVLTSDESFEGLARL
jgi:hypothetical protein